MSRKHHDVLSVEWIKLELLRTAYATRGGMFAHSDPRAVVVWYLVLAIAPWFSHNLTVLAILFAASAVCVFAARVGPLILGLFVFGLVLESVYIFAAAWFFGGDLTTMFALVELTLKLGVISLASMAAFVSLDPEKLSDAMLAFRMPSLVAFGVSYGYRMLPILIEQFGTVFEGYRLRMAPPQGRGILGWRTVAQWAQIAVLSFFPIFLNTARSVRTTVEALETRGFNNAGQSGTARRIRVARLTWRMRDTVTIAVTVVGVVMAFVAGEVWPLHR